MTHPIKIPSMVLPAWLATSLLTVMVSPALLAQEGSQDNTDDSVSPGVAEVVVFDGVSQPPWLLYLGSSNNWGVLVQGEETTSYKSKVITVRKVDNTGTGDAIQAEWNGGLGQVYWQDYNVDPHDYTELAAQGGALSMVLRVDAAPKKSVDLKMDCGYPCAGTLDMTQLFKSVPPDQWFRVSFKLSCFGEAGANLGNILAPFVIATKGKLTLSIADVRLLKDPPQESVVPCG